jgi:KaiC/GvpD/RAD55 family RecA-like ATPase
MGRVIDTQDGPYIDTGNGWKPVDVNQGLQPSTPTQDPITTVIRRTVKAGEVVPINVEWLWTDRVPLGMVTVFGGFPGVGKSTILYDLAARTSRDGKEVLVVTAEDHLAAVVRPRLEAAHANLNLVNIAVCPVELPDDVGMVTEIIETHEAALVVLDPLVAFIGDQVNTHRDHHVRRVLAPLGEMAEKTNAAVVVVIHTNKGQSSDPLMRISGSIGFTGAARSVVVAADDPNDDTRRILAVAKSNLAKVPSPLAYRLVGAEVGDISTSKVEWLGEAPEVDVRELLAVDRKERRGDAARRFLVDAGVQTVARPAAELETEADTRGINYRTLRRAREDLGIPAWKPSFDGGWWWGPKPTDQGDKTKGTDNRSVLSPSALPAEMQLDDAQGDKPVVAGDEVAIPTTSLMDEGESGTVELVRSLDSIDVSYTFQPKDRRMRTRYMTTSLPIAVAAQVADAIKGMVDEGPCPPCGASSSEPGYHGHAEGCPNYYREDAESEDA